MSKQNLKLSHAEGEDAADGGNDEAEAKGGAGGGIWAIGFNGNGNRDEVEEPLYAKLVRGLAKAFVDPQVISSKMIWAKRVSILL